MIVTAITRPGVVVGLLLWWLAAVLWTVGLSRSQTLAQPIPVPAATTNTFWAGYVATAGPYSSVGASWTVPRISCTHRAPTGTAYAWIGEGGYLEGLASPLIQAGTASDCLRGMPRYHVFYEWYPGIYATDFPLDVRPGDNVSIRITETQPDYWILSARDDSTGTSSTTATVFHVDTGSADFIVERPTICDESGCQQGVLSRFSSVTFRDIQTHGGSGQDHSGIRDAFPIALVDPAGARALAIPGRIGSDGDALSVLWRRSW